MSVIILKVQQQQAALFRTFLQAQTVEIERQIRELQQQLAGVRESLRELDGQQPPAAPAEATPAVTPVTPAAPAPKPAPAPVTPVAEARNTPIGDIVGGRANQAFAQETQRRGRGRPPGTPNSLGRKQKPSAPGAAPTRIEFQPRRAVVISTT